jgi:hypothetical protein
VDRGPGQTKDLSAISYDGHSLMARRRVTLEYELAVIASARAFQVLGPSAFLTFCRCASINATLNYTQCRPLPRLQSTVALRSSAAIGFRPSLTYAMSELCSNASMSRESAFQFLNLPTELRLMVYENIPGKKQYTALRNAFQANC